MNNVYVISAVRTAIGKSGRGTLALTRPDDLAAVVLKEAVKRAGVPPEKVEDVIMGCAIPEGEQGMNIGRIAVFRAGLPDTVAAATINRFCSSGLETMATAGAKIEAGMLQVAAAGGAESMSLIPMGGNKLTPNPTLTKERPEVYSGMGNCGDNVARDFKISREDCDRWALRSNQRAGKAIAEGKFKEEIVPVEVETPEGKITFDTDEGPRPDSTREGLAALRPAFAASPELGACTAGNSSQTSDGAAVCLLASGEAVKELNLKPLAKLRGYSVKGGDPKYLGPPQVDAIREACRQAGITPEELDLIECNEAFASQVIHVVRELGFDEEKVNPNGGAIALGHPLGCTGARLSATLLHEMKRSGAKWGCVTMCIGGGMGAAAVFERCG
jgi:acetyl-CoA acyltransferase